MEKKKQEIKTESRNIQERIEQEKVASMLENIIQTAKFIDYRILDELNSVESEQVTEFKAYLSSLESIAHHWGLLDGNKYMHRINNYGHLDLYINELPRSIHEGKLFCVKTFILSCNTPYMKLKDDAKIFISKEYSNAAGKLHLSFYQLYNTINKKLTAKIDVINQQVTASNTRVSILDFFKTIFTTD
jgi:hypothetical protein